MSRSARNEGMLLFSSAFGVRLAAVAFTTLTAANPYSLLDADGFTSSAAGFAAAIERGTVPVVHLGQIYDVWGLMLSPFWLIPGPSRVYARVGVALLGAVAVYNVYVLASGLHSRRAGVIAALPLLVYPSFVLAHASVLREATILFGLTTTARVLIAPSERLSRPLQFVVGTLSLALALVLRTDNGPVYLLVLVVAGLLSIDAVRSWVRRAPLAVGAGVGGLSLAAAPYAADVVAYLARVRRLRAYGRTEYLGWVFPGTVLEAIAFSWIGVLYFLFSPFPWMVESIGDFVVAGEAVVNLLFAAFAVFGARRLVHRRPAVAVALLSGIVVGSLLYGFGTANVGTAVRHRQMVLWAIFVLGAIGVASSIRVRSIRPGSHRRASNGDERDAPSSDS